MTEKKTEPIVEALPEDDHDSRPPNPHPGDIAIAVVAERIKNPNPLPPGPKPATKRIKKQ